MISKKTFNYLTSTLLILSMILCISVSSVTESYALYSSKYINLPYDEDGEVFYKGEPIDVYFEIEDIWTHYYTQPWALLLDSDNESVDSETFRTVPNGGTLSKSTGFSTKNLEVGNYTVVIAGVAVDEYDDRTYDIDSEDWEQAAVTVKVKKLKAPSSVKAVSGKGKVTVTFKKATGASKYAIYRSTKKGSGYKKIATVNKTKYVDKKVKRGKKYYYKVKTVRSVSKTVYSSYSKVSESKRVK